MKSFLQQLEEAFELYEESDELIQDSTNEEDDDELDEQNVTGAIAGYSTPNAFRKTTKKVGYASGVEEIKESVTPKVSKKHVPGQYQVVEFDEEIQNDKFSFSLEESDWWNKKIQYPSTDLTHTPGTAHKKDHHKKSIDEVIDAKYEQLIEGYRKFANGDSKISPEKKVKSTIQEIAKKLQEIETLVNYNSRLKTESGVTSTAYGPSTTKALTKISERLIKISERVRSLGE